MTVTPLGRGSARILTLDALDSLTRDAVFAHLADAGALLLRAPQTDLTQFSALVNRCSSRITFDPGREFVSTNAQLVNVGHDSIDLHCENANGPWRPDLAWFFCARAAREGGHTTICDGVKLWHALSPATRTLFQTTAVKYCRTYPEQKWKTFLPSLLPGKRTAADVTIADARRVLDAMTNIIYRVLDDNSIYAEYIGSALCRTTFRNEDAFANSMRGPYGGQRVMLADGSPVPTDVERDITETSRRLTDPIPWQDGDVAVVDNTRVMHGRTAYQDPRREIFAALSFR
jgi:hypothetical protein